MKAHRLHILFSFFFLFVISAFGQSNKSQTSDDVGIFTVRGSIYEKDTRKPIARADVQINGGKYTRTDFDGKFTIKAKVGDELVVSHGSFETVRYTIVNNERIYIEVLPENETQSRSKKFKSEREAFNKLIDSADSYIKSDAAKSIQFIGDALDEDISSKQSAEAYELLGDVHMFWKQYDLAISAYKISIQNIETNSAKLKLARAYLKNDNNEKSIEAYNDIRERKLTNYQKVELHEGIGDANLAVRNFTGSIKAYEEGLKVAKKHLITPKVTDLNSKIAQAYNLQGDITNARGYFSNSLNLAAQENKQRAVEEQIKVAEFNSEIEDYQNEIQLRKQAITSINDIERDSFIPNESSLTVQKQNYKIGNAYILSNELENAIPYLEKSVEEADKRGDLEVKKDATRKLSEALLGVGQKEQSYAVLAEHISVVDKLYTQKIQEISQAARFSRIIAEQQNRITSIESDRALSRSKYELTQERNKRQQLIIYSLLGGLVLFLITGYFMFKYIRQQRLANNLLALKSLRSQMNPHFIFNALNSVNSFIATNDERTANKYLSDFSYLMRAVLENSEEDFIPLNKEIELLQLYTKLEHFRFQDKFDYDIEVDDNIDVESFKIPPMLLQPYIENAVWHGLRYKTEKGKLSVSIRPKGKDEIEIIISDDGIGRERSKDLKTSNQKKQKSKGMGNIKKRVTILNEMYRDKVDVTVEDLENTGDVGTKVIVTLRKD